MLIIEGKKYSSLNEYLNRYEENRIEKEQDESFNCICHEECKKRLDIKQAKEKYKLLYDNIITTEEFCKLVERHGHIIEDLYTDDDKEKIHYLLSNISSLAYEKSEIYTELSLFLKFIKTAKICSRIELSEGQMIRIISETIHDVVPRDYLFIDFLLEIYRCEKQKINNENIIINILYFFKNEILINNDYLVLSRIINNILEMDITNMTIYDISKHIKSNYITNKTMLSLINKKLDIFADTFVDEYIKSIELDDSEIEEIVDYIMQIKNK